MANEFFDDAAELGSEEDDEEFNEETGEPRQRTNGVKGAGAGALDDSSEDDDEDDDEEAAAAVSTTNPITPTASLHRQLMCLRLRRFAKASLSMRMRTRRTVPGGSVKGRSDAAQNARKTRLSLTKKTST